MSFCFLLISYLFFHYFCVLGGSYVASISVLLSHRFLHRILDDLGVDLGVILGGFGGSKLVIFGIDLLMIFACRSKIAPRAAKSGQEPPKSPPRAPKSGPRGAPERPRAAQERPRAAHERPKAAQERPREAQEPLGANKCSKNQ